MKTIAETFLSLFPQEPQTASTPPCEPFTFSSPIVKATAASPPSFSPSVSQVLALDVFPVDFSLS